jgi:adenine phosphoribosyltransferase
MADIKRVEMFDVVEGFPKSGVTFYDIRGFLRRPQLWAQAIDEVAEGIKDLEIDLILAPDARAFLFAAPLCVQEGIRLAICRKPGRLPPPVLDVTYKTEYSTPGLEMGEYDIKPEDRVLLFDDVLATR